MVENIVAAILYGREDGPRYTQDSPVLHEVWRGYAENPDQSQTLLFTPHRDAQAHIVADVLHDANKNYRAQIGDAAKTRELSHIADVPGVVVGTFYFDEIVNVILPRTIWWLSHDLGAKIEGIKRQGTKESVKREAKKFIEASNIWSRPIDRRPQVRSRIASTVKVKEATARLAVLIGVIHMLRTRKLKSEPNTAEAIDKDSVCDALIEVFSPIVPTLPSHRQLIHLVGSNRRGENAIADSVPLTKADAARLLFDTSCNKIMWAVIDSGIDATHYAFRTPSSVESTLGKSSYHRPIKDPRESRVTQAYDFTLFWRLRSRDELETIRETQAAAEELAGSLTEIGVPDPVVKRFPCFVGRFEEYRIRDIRRASVHSTPK
jgi:hypothetical protein